MIVLPRRRLDGLIQLLEFAERRLTGLTRTREIRLTSCRHCQNSVQFLDKIKYEFQLWITFSFRLDDRRAECVVALDHVSRT